MLRKKKPKSSGDEVEAVLTPRRQLRGHTGVILRISWSPDGRMLATTSVDKTIQLWDAASGERTMVLYGHGEGVNIAAWSPDGSMLASASYDRTVRIWDAQSGVELRVIPDHTDDVTYLAWSPDRGKQWLATCSVDQSIRLWDTSTWECRQRITDHRKGVLCVAWSPDGKTLASGSQDSTVRLFDPETGKQRRLLAGHKREVTSLAWSPDGSILASSSFDKSINIWDPARARQTARLEGHTQMVRSVCFLAGGQMLASNSLDGFVLLWRAGSWEQVGAFPVGKVSSFWPPSLAAHPTGPVLAAPVDGDRVVAIWDVGLTDTAAAEGKAADAPVRYTTAKIVLVGDSGVGKTGLGWRLAHGKFQEHASTHGQQFWVVEALKAKRADGTECEAVLWDLAGQPDYRLVHSLFLDDVDLALVVFDPTLREKPLSGVEFWLKQLAHRRSGPVPAILVGARTDRGTATLTRAELEEFCKARGVAGGFINTSAVQGDGLDELMRRAQQLVAWDQMAATVTTATFKRIKEYVLSLKDGTEREEALVSPERLRERLLQIDASLEFTDAEMMTAVGHLEDHGYVTVLRRPQGGQLILLFPDVLVKLASSFALEARRNEEGLGALEEDAVLHGGYEFAELAGLSDTEREVLLLHTIGLFLTHNLCFRERFNERTLLVFPSLINEKRPRIGEARTVEDVSYRITGAVENVYAAMVVLLGYTNTFTRKNQWQNQAEYEFGPGDVCGFRQIAEREGEIELIIYYGERAAEDARLQFQGLVERFLKRRQLSIARFVVLACPRCSQRQERNVVFNQATRGFLFCSNCGNKLLIPPPADLNKRIALPPAQEERVTHEDANASRRTAFTAALAWVKAIAPDHARDSSELTCFISYAWGVPEHERWVERQLARDLTDSGFNVVLDRWHNAAIASNVARFVSLIDRSPRVLVVGTPLYLQKYENKVSTTGSIVAAEVDLIAQRLTGTEEQKRTVLPLLLAGDKQKSFPPLMRGLVYADFRHGESYFATLFDLILSLYGLTFDQEAVAHLRESVRGNQMGWEMREQLVGKSE